jgi:hypothetical protein
MLNPKRFSHLVRILLAHVSLKKHLQSQFPGFASCSHSALSPKSRSSQKGLPGETQCHLW